MGEPDREPEFNPEDSEPFATRGFDARHAPQPSFPGSELLQGESAREILGRITPGDPLGIAARVREGIAARAVLIDSRRVTPRALAHIARQAASYRGDPELTRWLAQQIDRALASCQSEDREDERAGQPAIATHYGFVTEAWGLEPVNARAACIVFNGLPLVVRRAWWALGVEGKSVHRYVAEGHGPPSLVEARVRRAIEAIGLLCDPGGADQHEREEIE